MAMTSLKSPTRVTTHNAFVGATAAVVANATGESACIIGQLRLQAGSGTKTISAAGSGRIVWATANASTFADGGTNLRIGIQRPDPATGIEDNSWTVFADLVGGTDTIIQGWNNTLMESGTDTLTHGDVIALVIEMTARAGADSVSIQRWQLQGNFPYGTSDIGSGPAKAVQWPIFIIIFDDGTYGWIEGTAPVAISANGTGSTTAAFADNTTPDEYAAVFQVPIPIGLGAATLEITNVTTGGFEMCLYEDAEGTPVLLEAVVVDPEITSALSLRQTVTFDQTHLLIPGVKYAISVRPTSATTITARYFTLGTGMGTIIRALQYFTLIKWSSRTNQSGAFTEVDADFLPFLEIYQTQISDGVGGGGSFTFIG